MKKIYIYLAAAAFFVIAACVFILHSYCDSKITIYSPTGEETQIRKWEFTKYKNKGWTVSENNAQTTMYSTDGRLCLADVDEVEKYKKVGWTDNISDASVSVYSDGGKELILFNDCAAQFLESAGSKWKNFYAASTLMYGKDGKSQSVFLNNVDEYLQKGFSKTPQTLDPSIPMIAITFDDGPSAQQTPRLLDICEQYGARVTFFVLGSRAENNKEILTRAAHIGCEVGSHTYSHKLLTKLAPDALINEIASTSDIITEATGKPPRSMRPPYGAYTDTVAQNAGAGIVLWSVDTLDWKTMDADQTVENILNSAEDGDIVLLHDIYKTSVDAAERVIPELQNRGFALVTVEELINSRFGGIENGSVYRKAENR